MSKPSPASRPESPGKLAAVILAAGAAERMGHPKALLQWGDVTLVRHCVETALASACDEVHVITGDAHAAIAADLAQLEVSLHHHEGWRSGMGSSIAAAVGRLSPGTRGLVILLCDQPFVTPQLIDRLLEAAAGDKGRQMVACRYRDAVGPPAFFASGSFGRLRQLTGDRGAKSLLEEARDAIALVDFPLGAFDIDTPEDYARALEQRIRQQETS